MSEQLDLFKDQEEISGLPLTSETSSFHPPEIQDTGNHSIPEAEKTGQIFLNL